jgi:hypothetical protein
MLRVWLSFGAFVALTTTVATRHEMWRDEVRAYSVATRAPSWSALASSLHQEGHPILWYAILRVAYGITHSPLVLPVAALLIGAIAAFLILRFAPFPFWVRLLAVFGVFLGYEYSVVARNYGIGVVFMVLACIAFPSRHERPIPLAFALALLANTSVHAAFASLIIAAVWLMDLFDPTVRRSLLRPAAGAAFAIVLAGVVLALMTARASPDMAFAFSPSHLQPGQVARALISDPGRSLRGVMDSGITAAGELPWNRIGLDPATVSRVFADIAILSLGWALRKNKACLAGMLLAIAGFAVIFRLVYPGALRHEGIMTFLLISLAWIALSSRKATIADRRTVAFGLLPLLVTQTLALPLAVRRDFLHPASASKAFGALIRQTPRYRNAIVMGEPDYMMESVLYYAPNRVYMPRQGEYHHRVLFDQGARRRLDFHLGTLVTLADSLGCASGQPVLLAIAYPRLLTDTAGEAHPAYRGTLFRWNGAERARLFARGKLVAQFTGSITDESYSVFEIPPATGSECPGRIPH